MTEQDIEKLAEELFEEFPDNGIGGTAYNSYYNYEVDAAIKAMKHLLSKLSVQVKEEEILTDEFDQYLMENFDIAFSGAVNKYVWSKTEGKINKPYSLLEIYQLFLTEKGKDK